MSGVEARRLARREEVPCRGMGLGLVCGEDDFGRASTSSRGAALGLRGLAVDALDRTPEAFDSTRCCFWDQ